MNDTTLIKKPLLWILLVIIIGGGIFWWYMYQRVTPEDTLPPAPITTPAPPAAENLEQIENEATNLNIENPDTELENIGKELGL